MKQQQEQQSSNQSTFQICCKYNHHEKNQKKKKKKKKKKKTTSICNQQTNVSLFRFCSRHFFYAYFTTNEKKSFVFACLLSMWVCTQSLKLPGN